MSEQKSPEVRRAVLRLSLQTGGILLAFVLLLGALVFWVVSVGQQEALTRTLIDSARVESVDQAPAGVFVGIYTDGAWQLPTRVRPGLPDIDSLTKVEASGAPQLVDLVVGEHQFRVRTSVERGRIVQVAVDQHETREELDRLLIALLIAGGIAVAAAAAVAAWLARRAVAPLAHALAMQRRFVADASHELRTPLTLLSTRAQLLRRSLDDQAKDEPVHTSAKVDEIITDARRLAEILDDLLIAADPRQTATIEPVDLSAAARDAVQAMQSDAEQRGIALQVAGDNTAIIIRGARMPIHRLFTALISNALDFARSTVIVEVLADGHAAVIRVSDDGPGFPPGADERIFERFASSRPATERDGRQRHYGIGLALVAEIAAKHGGRVSLGRSAAGGGAILTVTLPLSGNQQAV